MMMRLSSVETFMGLPCGMLVSHITQCFSHLHGNISHVLMHS